MGVRLAVLNSMWWPVNERNSRPVWLRPSMSSMLKTSNVSQLKRMSADSLPVLYLDFSSSVIDFESQIVGDDCCWSPSLTGTTWIENKSLNQMMSPDSSRRNLMPFSPSFSVRLESNDSQIWKLWVVWSENVIFSLISLFYLPIAEERMVVCCTTTHYVCIFAKMISTKSNSTLRHSIAWKKISLDSYIFLNVELSLRHFPFDEMEKNFHIQTRAKKKDFLKSTNWLHRNYAFSTSFTTQPTLHSKTTRGERLKSKYFRIFWSFFSFFFTARNSFSPPQRMENEKRMKRKVWYEKCFQWKAFGKLREKSSWKRCSRALALPAWKDDQHVFVYVLKCMERMVIGNDSQLVRRDRMRAK